MGKILCWKQVLCIEKDCFCLYHRRWIGEGWEESLEGIGRKLSGVSETDCLTDSTGMGGKGRKLSGRFSFLEESV